MGELKTSIDKPTVVSLFCGAGGMDIGFELEGYKTIWANDFDKDSCLTHKAWSGAEVVCEKIENVDLSKIPKADVVLGGFPCQGFSLAGPRKIDDKRNSLYRYYVDVIEKVKPKVFIAENVKGILTLGNGKIIQAIASDFASKGYDIKYQLLNAADYSVPQDRYRVIMVGIRQDLKLEFNYPNKHLTRVSIKDALSGLRYNGVSSVCMAPFSPRFMSRNRKRGWDDVSFTIPAMAKQVPLHPGSPDMKKISKDCWQFGDKDKTRRFSWAEAAAIQTFPRDMKFYGNIISIYKQIGNAVPVNLARAIAKQLNPILRNEENECLEAKLPTGKPMSMRV